MSKGYMSDTMARKLGLHWRELIAAIRRPREGQQAAGIIPRRGSQLSGAKLTEADIPRLRAMHASGAGLRAIAADGQRLLIAVAVGPGADALAAMIARNSHHDPRSSAPPLGQWSAG